MMSSLRDDLEWEEAVQGASHGGPWPAFVDLFAATALIVLVFFAVMAFQYLRLETDESVVRSQVTALRDSLTAISGKETGFSVDAQGQLAVLLTLEENVSFSSGKYSRADLQDSAKVLLAKVGGLIQSRFSGLINEIEVVGHADRRPSDDPSNWVLSAARAATVAEFLIDTVPGLNPCIVVSSGRAEYYPRDRAGLKILRDSLAPDQRDVPQDLLAPDRRVEILLRPVTSDTTESRRGCVNPKAGRRSSSPRPAPTAPAAGRSGGR
jgi:outer membrane protein OmpA-like peptidoglycan-associated protein